MMAIFHTENWLIGIEDIQLLLIFEWMQEYLGVLQIDRKKIKWNQILDSIH